MFQCKCKSILRSAMFLLLMLSTLGFAADEFQPLTAQAALQVRMTGFRCNDGGQPGGEISYNWSTGELGNTWAEGEWVPYQIILTSIPPGLEGLDSLVVSFDFTRPQAGDFYRFVDLVRGIQAGTTELTDAQGWPWPDGSPFTVTPRESVEVAQNYPDIHEWPGFTFLNLPNERVNRTLTGGLDVPPGEDKHIFKIYKQDLLDAGIDPNATTVIIYCQLHESRTFIWENRLQANYDASPTDVWGGYLYGTDAWDTLSVFGAGYVPGASGHLHLENISGSKDVPIPIPERLPGAVSGLKWLDANGDGIKDELEPTLSGWQIHVSGMVEGINFTTSALTDGSGSYSFANLTAGTWTIKEDEQRDDPPETGYWETYPTVGTVFGQGTGVAVGPPPPDAAGVGWEVLLTLDITDQDSMNFGNRLCEMVCEVTPPDAEICDYSSQTFCVIPIDGIPPFTYQWSNGPTDSCITVSPGAGFYTYRVFVTDAAGCTTSCQATLTVNESPTCSVDPPSAEICDYSDQEFCVIPSGGTAPYTYAWDTGASDSCITVSESAGSYTYRVIVTDAEGCTTSCQATLTVNESPTCSVDPPSAEICDYSDQEFCVIPSGGTAPYTYDWSTGASDSCITASESAGSYTYRVIVTDAEGCTTSCQATLTVNESPTCSVEPPSAEICDYSDQEFCVIPSGGTAPYTYSWDTGASDSCITVSESAGSYTYRVIVTDAEGCTTSCQATLTVNESPTCSVDPPSAEICDYSDQEFCVIPSGGTAPYTYAWDTGASDSCITVSESAGSYTYRVIVTDAEGCTTSCQATLTVNESPLCTVSPPNAEICDGEPQEFCVIPNGGTAPYTYDWSTGDTDSCIMVSPSPGSYTYRVVVTDAEGCTTSCEGTLTVYELPTCRIDPDSAKICTGDSQEFCVIPSGGTPPYTYLWSTGSADSCITVTPSEGSHTYSVVVTDDKGCVTSCEAILIVEPCGCTFTLGGWGSDCPGPQQNDRYSTQPGCIHDHFFDQVFPNGVWIGNPAAIVPTTSGATGTQTGTELMTGPAPMDGPGVAGAGLGVIGPSKAGASSVINGWYWLKWTSSTAVKTFLRSGGGPALALTQNLTNPDWAPTTTGNWGRQILALRLNVEFTCAGVFDSVGLVEGDYCYGDFIITSECGMGKFDGMSVYTFLAIADSAVGGLDVLGSYGADFSDVNYTATCLNELFDGCGSDEGIPIWQSAGAGAKPSSEEAGTRPDKFSLSQNYPNPFNPECNIDYAIPIDCHVRLSVYNVLGQKIRVLVDEQQSAGYKSVVWDGKDSQGQELTTGVYFYRIQAGDFVESRKMVLIK